MTLFGKLFKGTSTGKDGYPLPQPAETFYAIGDIHGRYDLLRPLVEHIQAEHPRAPIVCVGDYIDRGEQSREVIEYLMELRTERLAPLVCLLGNHEEMCLRFIENPKRGSDAWLRHGGVETLASFGLDANGARNEDLAQGLAEAMGEEMLDWLRGLRSFWRSGNVVVTHAGADPKKPIDRQPLDNLIWGHTSFGRVARNDGLWIVHGHTIVDEPAEYQGIVSIDTGAYETGHLSAARVTPEGIGFLAT